MKTAVKQGLVLGLAAGVLVSAGLYVVTGSVFVFLLVPFTALMGMGPQLLSRPSDEDDDDRGVSPSGFENRLRPGRRRGRRV